MVQSKSLIVLAIVFGMVVMAMGIAYIGSGNVRHVQIYYPEQVKQTVAFQDIDGQVQLVGLTGTGERDNPTLVTRVSFEYVLTVINRGDKHHRLYIEEFNVQTELLEPGQNDTISIIPTTEGIYNYYDKRQYLELLGQIKAVYVSPDERF